MDSYSGLVNEMGNMAQAMVKAKHPDSKIINNKQESIVQQLKNLQAAANVRRKRLMETMQRHEYFSESIDFEKWMDDQVQTAISEEFGHDYEHLLVCSNMYIILSTAGPVKFYNDLDGYFTQAPRFSRSHSISIPPTRTASKIRESESE